MEHLTEALDRLGVKTCPVCGKTGAKSLCLGCRSVSYCGKACQKAAWPTHKRECRRIVREKEKFLDGIAAACAADEAIAANACRPNIPKGAECYICGNDKYWKGDLVRGCACRGPHAGFVHIRCLVANAESKVYSTADDDRDYEFALVACVQCRQQFRGPVDVALKRAAWLHFAGRAETDYWRHQAMVNVGAALVNADRPDEALFYKREVLATMQRIYGSGDLRTIDAEERVAVLMSRYCPTAKIGEENLRQALQTLTRVHTLKAQRLGRDNQYTLETAEALTDLQLESGMVSKAEIGRRELAATRLRLHRGDETHFEVIQSRWSLAAVLVRRRKFAEARDLRDALRPVAHRVLGPDHRIVRDLQCPFWDF